MNGVSALHFRWCVAVFMVGALCVGYHGQAMINPLNGTWSVSVLVPGEQPIPPRTVLRAVNSGIVVAPETRGVVEAAVDWVAEAMHLVHRDIPSYATGLCPISTKLNGTAVVTGDGIHVKCNSELFDRFSWYQWNLTGGVFYRTFSPPYPLSNSDGDGHCTSLPFAVASIHAEEVALGHIVIVAQMVMGGSALPCVIRLEMDRWKQTDGAWGSSYTSLVMLVVAVALRMLPRYVLTRKGQLDKGSYRGTRAATLTEQQRRQLLRKQDELVYRMKEEDRKKAT